MCDAVSYVISSYNITDGETEEKHKSSISHPIFKLGTFKIQVLCTVFFVKLLSRKNCERILW
jgi:hypothetical protein